MNEIIIPGGYGEDSFTEKRSRFIGRIWPCVTEEEAMERIAETKAKHHDAKHNVWAFITRDGKVSRYSDDGEPQGTGGIPVMNVLKGAQLSGVCCVVTRYFGGVLLGTGGLSRAYAQGAKIALEQAGTAVLKSWKRFKVECNYSQFGIVEHTAKDFGGAISGVDYGEKVVITVCVPLDRGDGFKSRISEATAATVTAWDDGEELRPE